jgi:hypothetical protein
MVSVGIMVSNDGAAGAPGAFGKGGAGSVNGSPVGVVVGTSELFGEAGIAISVGIVVSFIAANAIGKADSRPVGGTVVATPVGGAVTSGEVVVAVGISVAFSAEGTIGGASPMPVGGAVGATPVGGAVDGAVASIAVGTALDGSRSIVVLTGVFQYNEQRVTSTVGFAIAIS